jgi:hypothetical protein
MKKNILKEAGVLFIATMMVLMSVVVMANADEQATDVALIQGVPQANKGDFPILFTIDLPNLQCVGVGYDGQYFWVSAGDSDTGYCEFYIYDEAGILVDGPIHQGGGATGWGHRDMCWDGTYMFGSYDPFIDGFSDPATYEGAFTGPISPNRAMAFDGTYFYTSGFSEDLWQLDWDGTWGSTAGAVNLGGPHSGCYGLAYDSKSNCLWMTTADYSGNLFQFDLTGALMNTYTTLPEYDIHGGCTMAQTTTYGYILCVLQQFSPDQLVFYDLGYGGPDLDCDGVLGWENVEPGATVTGEFTVENIGDPESELDWEVAENPEWGTWTFDPASGTDLTPEDGPVTVSVEVVAPTDGTEFEGEVKVVNTENVDDFCIIDCTMTDPVSQIFAQPQQITEVVRTTGFQPIGQDLIWDNGDPDFVNGVCCQRIGSVAECDSADDFTLGGTETIGLAIWQAVDDTTYAWEGLADMIIYADAGGQPGAELVDRREVDATREYLGEQWSRPWYEYTMDLAGQGAEVTLDAGTYFLLLRPYSAGTSGQSFWLTSPAPGGSTSSIWFRSAYFGYPDWVPGSIPFGADYDVNFKLYGEGGAAPDLDCDGVLNWENIQPESTVTGEFTVENIGDPDSMLDWEVSEWPEWGTWTFDPASGDDLTPAAGTVTVNVEVVAPAEDEGTEFTGEVKIINSNNPSDFCIIDCTMTDAVSQSLLMQVLQNLAQRFPIIAYLVAMIA